MEKVFKNKKLAYVLIGILLALQLARSIATWCGGGFNGGSLILCILMLSLLALTAIGVYKGKNSLTLVSGSIILGVTIYVIVSECSGLIDKSVKGTISSNMVACYTLISISALLLIGSLVLLLLKAFGIKKDLRKLNIIFALLSALFAIIAAVVGYFDFPTNPDAIFITLNIANQLFGIILPFLIACVGYQLEFKE